MTEIPKEAYYIIGTIVITKYKDILEFFNSRVKSEVKNALMENSIQSLTLEIGKLNQKVETIQKDLNEAFKKLRS